MSFYELLIVLAVALYLCKPSDAKLLFKKFKELRRYIASIKNRVTSVIDDLDDEVSDQIVNKNNDIVTDKNISKEIDDEIDNINYYLQRISVLGERYDGEYSSEAIKKYYYNIIKNRCENSNKK